MTSKAHTFLLQEYLNFLMFKTSLKMEKNAWILLIGEINSDIFTEAKLESVRFIDASMDNIQEMSGTAVLNSS